jgi:hypothetical protein
MMSVKGKKGQGTIEYLVIIAIVVVIALVVVGLLMQLLQQGSGVNEQSSKSVWTRGTPFGISGWATSSPGASSTITFILKNNTIESVKLYSMDLYSGDVNTVASGGIVIAPSGTYNIKLDLNAYCGASATAGTTKFSVPKSGINIKYYQPSDSTLLRTQYAEAEIIGTC